MMRVVIDGDCLENRNTGIGNYTYSLLVEMLNNLEDSEEIQVAIQKKRLGIIGDLELDPRCLLTHTERSLWKYLPWPPPWIKGFDLYHQPNYIPHRFPGRTVVTIHDMSYRVFPQYHPQRRVMMLRAFERRLKNVDQIITISEFSRQEILRFLEVPEHKVTVTYLGAGSHFRPLSIKPEQKHYLRSRCKLPENYLLYVGTIEPRKNLVRLLRAFNLFRKEMPESGVKLVMAGGKGWLYEEIFALVKTLQLEKEVVFTDFVEGPDLPIIYNMSIALVYPSLYEGFGLPPLEAMACGIPVISSNTASIPEVVGSSGILVDPYQVDEIAQAICQVVGSSELRKEMCRAGLARAQDFSWKKCALETMNVYRQLV